MKTYLPDKKVAIIFIIIMIAWVGAWNIWLVLNNNFEIFSNECIGFIYWTIAKIIIWILPALWLMQKTDCKVGEIFRVSSWRKCLIWGIGLGSVLVLTSIGGNWLNNSLSMPNPMSFTFVNAVIIAPVFEEFLMRGAIMKALRKKHRFVLANSVTAVLFVILHFPGWYYTGSLLSNLSSVTSGALAIFVIGWLCGLATEKGETVIAGIIVHTLNNFV